MCSAQNGFDSNTFGGLRDAKCQGPEFGTNIAATNGILAVLYVIGNVIGSFGAGLCADRWGRKPDMFIASSITLIGAIANAEKRRDLIAGRIVLGVGTVMLGPSAQSWAVEMAHPAWRGIMVDCFPEYVARLVPKQSKLPMALQDLPSILVMTFVWFIPESPRWYIAQGEDEKADVKYHGYGDPNSKTVSLEMEEMNASISTNGFDKK